MNLSARRPLFCFAAGVILCCALLFAGGALPYSVLPAVCLAAAAFLLFAGGVLLSARRPGGEGKRLLFAAGIGLLCGLFLCFFHPAVTAARAAVSLCADGVTHTVTATVSEKSYGGDDEIFCRAKITSLDGAPCRSFSASLTLAGGADLLPGDLFTASLRFSRPAEREAGYARRSSLAADGCFVEGEGEFLSCEGSAGYISGMLFALRAAIGERLTVHLSADGAGLARALLLGDRSDLPDRVARDFRTLGISHLLAVSGLHLTILAGSLNRLLRRRASRRISDALTALFVLLYMALCGFFPSVTRAGLMFLLYLLGSELGEQSDGVTSLCTAGLLILLWSPYAVLDAGLQLSFLATLGILTLGRELQKDARKAARPRLVKLRNALAVSTAALVFTFPVSVALWGRFSLLGPFATLLFTPLFALLLLLLPAALLLSFLTFAGELLFFLSDGVSGGIFALAGLARFVKSLCLPLSSRAVFLFCGGFFALLLAVLLLPLPKRLRTAPLPVLALALILCGIGCALPAAPRLLYRADAASETLLLSGGETTLVDLTTGGKTLCRCAENDLPALRADGIDTLLLTHLHERHAAVLGWLCENDYPTRLLLPRPTDGEAGIAENLAAIAGHYGLAVEYYDRGGDPLPLGRFTYTPLRRVTLARSSHPCVAFRLESGARSLLYVGSAYPASALPEDGADFYFVGMHGPTPKEGEDTDYASVLPGALRLELRSGQSILWK